MLKKCAILLSRQMLRPSGSTSWVKQTVSAIEWVKKNDLSLFTSIGLQTWEFLIFLAKTQDIYQHIVIPSENNLDFEAKKKDISEQFDLDSNNIDFQPLISEDSKKLPSLRDNKIITEADVLLPVSIRENGNMDNLLKSIDPNSSKEINRSFQVVYQKRQSPLSYHVNSESICSEIATIGKRYIIHWTRASNGPWPSEKQYQYFNDIVQNDIYPRDAFATLQNIIRTNVIKASSNHMPENIPTVSFSALSPYDAVSLMKWRARYTQMTFEPYGIGIEKDYANICNIFPVRYHKKKCEPENIPKWLFQSVGTKSDWRKEDEYRFLGDFALNAVAKDKLICFCHKPHEANIIRDRFGILTFALIS